MKIIIVDDEKDVREVLYLYLQQEHHECRTAKDPIDALDIIPSFHPDVILTDFNMPKMTGIEFLEIIREKYPEIRVLLFTGFADVDNAIAAINLGARGFFQKPLELDMVKQTLEELNRELKGELHSKLTRQELIREYARLRGAFPSLQFDEKLKKL